METRHRQVKLRHPSSGETIEVDEGLAPLLFALWSVGIDTVLSCEDNHPHYLDRGVVWICFPDSIEAERFLNVVASDYSDDPNSLYQRVKAEGFHMDDWLYDVNLNDWNVEEIESVDSDNEVVIEERSTGPALFVFETSIRFPRSDLPAVKNAFGVPS